MNPHSKPHKVKIQDQCCFISKHKLAILPTRNIYHSVGYDLHSVEDVVIKAGYQKEVDTGVGIYLPFPNLYGQIVPIQKLAHDCRILVMGGLINPNHDDSIRVLLFNLSQTKSFRIKKGDLIAKIVVQVCYTFGMFGLGFNCNNDNGTNRLVSSSELIPKTPTKKQGSNKKCHDDSVDNKSSNHETMVDGVEKVKESSVEIKIIKRNKKPYSVVARNGCGDKNIVRKKKTKK